MIELYSVILPTSLVIMVCTILWIAAQMHHNLPKFVLLIAIMFACIFGITKGIEYFKGWATEQEIQGQNALLSYHTDEERFIWIWLADATGVPRAYQIPYSREKHQALEDSMKAKDKGLRPMVGQRGQSHQGYMLSEQDDLAFYIYDVERSAPKN